MIEWRSSGGPGRRQQTCRPAARPATITCLRLLSQVQSLTQLGSG